MENKGIDRLSGGDFEKITAEALAIESDCGSIDWARYGVKMSFQQGKYRPIHSMPDFEGVIAPGGRQFVFDCKVSSGPSLKMDKVKSHQMSFMLGREARGAICFLFVHFNARELKTKSEPPETYAIPVATTLDLWYAWARGEFDSISRSAAEEHGIAVPWVKAEGKRKYRPNMLEAINGCRDVLDGRSGYVL